MSITITSSNFILFSLFGYPRKIYLCSLFLIYIKSNHIVPVVKQLAADGVLTFHFYAKTLAGELDPDLKANLNGHLSICHSPRSELGSKSYIFMENDKIISLTNLFQHLLYAEILSE